VNAGGKRGLKRRENLEERPAWVEKLSVSGKGKGGHAGSRSEHLIPRSKGEENAREVRNVVLYKSACVMLLGVGGGEEEGALCLINHNESRERLRQIRQRAWEKKTQRGGGGWNICG